MDLHIKTYEEFAQDFHKKHKKYDGNPKCFISGCDKPGYYEGGDARFYCGMCAEHVGLPDRYLRYLKDIERTCRVRMLWDKDDPTLGSLYNKVTHMINAIE